MITDELYHDDLDSMTFGRKDQNELYHYGIKGQSWGKRRFQNEDGSLTSAGRNRYDVGAPLSGINVAKTDSGTGSRSGGGSFNKTSAVNRQTFASSNRTSGGGMTNVARTDSGTGNRVGGFSAARNAITASSSQSVKNSTNSGRKAADNLFSRIGNAANGAINSAKQWGDQAAQDVANTAQNTYNGARDLAGQAVDAVKDKAQDVAYDIQSLANTPEARNIANGVNSAIDRAKELGGQVSGAAQNAYNGARNAANQVGDWVGDRARDVGNAAVNAYKDANNFVDKNITGNSDRSLARSLNMVADAFPNSDTSSVRRSAEESQAKADNSLFGRIGNAANQVGDWVGDRAQDVAGAAQNAYNGAREVAGQAGSAVSNAASSVRDWGAGAVDKGRQAFENLFGRSEPPVSTLSDLNPQIETETILRENIIPEQRITEQIIPEQRITEQRIPEQRIIENRQQEAERTRALSDKPSGLSDDYWMEYKANGGTRAQYERELKNRRNNQNGSR